MASNADLPKWAWDLIIALLNHEDDHSANAPCLNAVISAVPLDVRDQAEAIRSYVRSASQSAVKERIEETWNGLVGSFAAFRTDIPPTP